MTRLLLLVVLSLGLGVAGCGHPASREECELILTKSAELKLKEDNVTDPEKVAEKLAGLKQAKGDELLKSCVGKVITKSALECVRNAQSSDAVDGCLY
jgi:small lipoprotein (TIGR04454 family)